MRDFMIRGGAISVDHLAELHLAADDLVAAPVEPASALATSAASSHHAGAGIAASGVARGLFAFLTPEQKAAALAYRGEDAMRPTWADWFAVCPPDWIPYSKRKDMTESQIATERVVRVYAAARRIMAAAGSLPLTAPEAWMEGDWPFWKRLIRGRPTADCEALWARWSWGDEGLDDIGVSLGLPRARLVPVEG